jgi:hypothetical protein
MYTTNASRSSLNRTNVKRKFVVAQESFQWGLDPRLEEEFGHQTRLRIEESDGSVEAILDILGQDPACRFVLDNLENQPKRQRIQ